MYFDVNVTSVCSPSLASSFFLTPPQICSIFKLVVFRSKCFEAIYKTSHSLWNHKRLYTTFFLFFTLVVLLPKTFNKILMFKISGILSLSHRYLNGYASRVCVFTSRALCSVITADLSLTALKVILTHSNHPNQVHHSSQMAYISSSGLTCYKISILFSQCLALRENYSCPKH